MVLMRWNDTLRVGHSEIDAEHEKLFAMLDTLQTAMKKGKSQSVLAGLFNELVRHSALHFHHEEAYMQEIGFIYFNAHKAEHDMLMKELNALQARIAAGHLMISVGVCHFLNRWLWMHIKDSDTELAVALAVA